MTLFLILQVIAANTPTLPYPTEIPTWGNLIPWVVGFFGMLIASMLYFIINRQSKQIDSLEHTVRQGLEKLANAVYLSHRARLIQLAVDPNVHPVMKEQCETMVREIDQATQSK